MVSNIKDVIDVVVNVVIFVIIVDVVWSTFGKKQWWVVVRYSGGGGWGVWNDIFMSSPTYIMLACVVVDLRLWQKTKTRLKSKVFSLEILILLTWTNVLWTNVVVTVIICCICSQDPLFKV